MRFQPFLATLIISLLCGTASAEKADLSPEELLETATDVVVGKVQQIYTRSSEQGKYDYTHFVAEVRVDEVEKGDACTEGALAYVRYWHRRWKGPGLPEPGTSGHRGRPDVGDTVRIYLARNAYDGFSFENKDGGLNVIGANGFEILQKPKKTQDSAR